MRRRIIGTRPFGALDLALQMVSHLLMGDALVQPGDVLAGKYRVERVLGRGNMGVVVAATNLALGQLVALKFMLGGLHVGQEDVGRFLREARAAARLKSQHVTRVLDVGALDDGAPYTVMEHLKGKDLKAILAERGPLPIADAVEYVLQACEGIAEAHAAGIVHRDIKPANLFLTTDASRMPCVKIFDFGISKLAGDLTLTQETQSMGSPLYMSPEQIGSAHDVDGRADLWSLAVSLYELLAGKGRTPFDAATIEQICYRIFAGQATPLAAHRQDIPPGLEAVIGQCLQKERNLRFRNVADFAAALAPWAPARAAAYPERVARVLGVHTEPARPTDVLPAPSTEALAAATANEARSARAASPAQATAGLAWSAMGSSPIESARNTALALSSTQCGRVASLPGMTTTRRDRPIRAVIGAVTLGVISIVGLGVALRGLVTRERVHVDPMSANSGAPAAVTVPSAQSSPTNAAPVTPASSPVVALAAASAPAPASATPVPPRPATSAIQAPRPKPSTSPRPSGGPRPKPPATPKDTIE